MDTKNYVHNFATCCILSATLVLSGCATYPLPDGARTHVTSTVSTRHNDGIVIHVLNYSNTQKTTRVRIYTNTGAGAVQITDTGPITVAPNWQWGLGYTVDESGEYWVEISTNSETLIPKAYFERHDDDKWVPFVTYNPGDFATFDPQQRRLW